MRKLFSILIALATIVAVAATTRTSSERWQDEG